MHGCLECIRRRQIVEIHILTSAGGGNAIDTILEIAHGVVGAADLEAVDQLGVLALDVDVVAEPIAEDGHVEEVGLLDDIWDGLKFYIGFGDEESVVVLAVGGEEMVWEAALDGGVWGAGRVLEHDLETRSG